MAIATDLLALTFPVDQLRELEGNPRKGDIDAVARSYSRFGQTKPIVARHNDDGTGTVIAGNHQLKAARKLGWSEIAVVWRDDLTDDEARGLALADNRTADLGSYDDDLLAELLSYVADDEDLLAATGYDQAAIEKLVGVPDVPAGADDVPDLPEEPTTKPGDLWLLGKHRLLCGDSTSETDVQRLMNGEKADLVWTDPPYGVNYVGGFSHRHSVEKRRAMGGLDIDNDAMGADELRTFLANSLGLAAEVCRPGAVWFVAATSSPLFQVFGAVLTDLDIWHQTLIWEKSAFVMGRSDYHYRHECLFYGWVPGAAHQPPPDRTGDSIWCFDRPTGAACGDHPTRKPVELVARAVGNHTKPGDIVLDPFAGSGTTLIAADQLKRTAYLMEVDPRYCDVIVRRWEEVTGEKAVLDGPHA